MNRIESPTCAPGTLDKWALARKMRHAPTTAESKLWGHLRAGNMLGLKFRRQHVISGFIADFYCHALRLVIEVDGEVHKSQIEYDHERQTFLEQCGLTVLRFSNQDILTKPTNVLAKIELWCYQTMADATPGTHGSPD